MGNADVTLNENIKIFCILTHKMNNKQMEKLINNFSFKFQ